MNNMCMGTNIKQISPISELKQHLFPVCIDLIAVYFQTQQIRFESPGGKK